MYATRQTDSTLSAALRFGEVVYHGAVRSLRQSDGNALMGLLKTMSQTVLMVLVFYVMLQILGMRGAAIRGDYFLYLLSGIFMFMTHVKTMGGILSSEGPTSPMMQHAPMNTLVAILSSALSTLYIQMLALVLMIFAYHVAWNRVTVHDIPSTLGMVLLSWYTGIGLGLVLLALKPWYPGLTGLIQQLYTRINLFASGKMMVGNMLPFFLLPMFTWNPLFHIIDQGRGYIFINYSPHFSNWHYPFWVGTALIMLGFIGEGYTRRHASLSWFAKR